MPQSFKNAWRWLVGASAAAMLIASISPAANAQTPDTGIISLCVARNGKIVGVNIHCKPHNFQLTWNIPGPRVRPGRRAIPVPLARRARRDRRDRKARSVQWDLPGQWAPLGSDRS